MPSGVQPYVDQHCHCCAAGAAHEDQRTSLNTALNAASVSPEDPRALNNASAAQLLSLPADKIEQGAARSVDEMSRILHTGDATADPLRMVTSESNVGRASVPHDEPHWQDDYATNWDRIGMNRHASTSDATASAVQQVSAMAALEESDSGVKAGNSKTWACKLCTFAENPSHSIRCEACDTTRGSTLQDFQHTSSASRLQSRGIGVLQGWQCPPLEALGAAGGGLLHDTVTLCGAHRSNGNAESLQQPTVSKHSKQKISSKRSQQTISGFLDAGLVVKRWHTQQSDNNRAVCTSASTGVKWQCSKCQQYFLLNEQAEHNDYHVALDLHRQSFSDGGHGDISAPVWKPSQRYV